MKLFEPGKIGSMTLKNRIILAPMGMGQVQDYDGRLSQRLIDHYVARARGGTGLIITGLNRVSREIETSMEKKVPLINDFLHVARLNELAEAIHDYGAKMAVQLTAGFGRVAPEMLLGEEPVAPSVLPYFHNPQTETRALTTKEVQRLVEDFESAARLVKSAGVDAIQIHAHEGYLWDQFQTALWNQRTDKYGGSFENRLRFALEAIGAIKRGAGDDFPIIYRFGLRHRLKGGRKIDEGLRIAGIMEKAGVHAIEVDAGCYEAWYWAHPTTYQPPGLMVDMAEAAKRVLNIPVIAVGKLGYPDLAEKILKEGRADFICLGRALLADPEWPHKVQEGRSLDIRPCIGDNEGCLGRLYQGKYTSCAVNPMVGMDREFALVEAREKKEVLVVGGGPAGMEAARVAAIRGHQVTLWEENDTLGGNLIAASVPAFKKDLAALLKYLARQLDRLKVKVQLKKKATDDAIRGANPQVLLLAAGATPLIPDIPGNERENTVSATDVLLGRKKTGHTVVVVGGGMVGCEVALHLAQQGKACTVMEALDQVMQDAFKANRAFLLEQMDVMGVDVRTGSRVVEITGSGVIFEDRAGNRRQHHADSVVFALGLVPRNDTVIQMNNGIPETHKIGDCVAPRNVMSALWEGFRIARLV